MKKMFRFTLLLLLVSLFGCASGPPKVKARYFWPQPPDEPKIEYLGAYGNVTDLTEKNLMTAIIGEENSDTINYPMAVTTDDGGKVYVSDLSLKVVEFDFTAKKVSSIGGAATEGVKAANGLAMDADGNIYVGDSTMPVITVIGKNGAGLAVINLSGQAKSTGLFAIDRERKRLVIPDPMGHQVHIVDLTGKIIKTIKTFGDGDGFNMPAGAAVDPQGNIIVADTMNARIVRFTPDGEYLSHFGNRGDGVGDFGIIKGVAVDSMGHIYVADAKEHKIVIFNDKGEPLLSFGRQDDTRGIIGGFALPLGIYINRNDTIYIADRMNKRFQVFQYLSSDYLAKNPITQDTVSAKPFTGGKEGAKKKTEPAK